MPFVANRQNRSEHCPFQAWGRTIAFVLLATTLGLATAAAQESTQVRADSRNPLGRDAAAVKAGDELFHERCAVCHGQQAEGAMASNLQVARSVRRGTELALFELIRSGIPGTEMLPQSDLPEERLWQLVSYLRSLAHPAESPQSREMLRPDKQSSSRVALHLLPHR